jgi:hypothetical protein
MPNSKIAILIDGGFLRVVAKKAKKTYDPEFIEKFAHACKRRTRLSSVFSITTAQCIAAP